MDLPTASPLPAPTACEVANANPRPLHLAKPAYTPFMEENHKSGNVEVTVYVDERGVVTRAEITRSSGDAYLDGTTYDAAVATTYAAALKDCAPAAGTYLYRTRYVDRPAETVTPSPVPSPSPTPAGPPPADAPPVLLPDIAATLAPDALPPLAPTPTPTPVPPPSPAPTPAPAPTPTPTPAPAHTPPPPPPAPSPAPKSAGSPSAAASDEPPPPMLPPPSPPPSSVPAPTTSPAPNASGRPAPAAAL